jgi:hypothetical protein
MPFSFSAAASGSFAADLVTGPFTVQRFVDRPTPGNVGVCLSGGGSRALTAGMGQLRGLQALGLLGQTRAVSTVSGGSWLGVTFEFLTGATGDDAYLNQYVPDPGTLVPTTTPGRTPAQTLDVLPTGNIGNSISTRLFSVPALAVQAYLLFKFFHTPPSFLWQALIGLHILKPYGLYRPGRHLLPTDLFSWDEATLEADVTRGGTQLQGETAHLVAAGAGRATRPYLLCNTSMFLIEPNTAYRQLAPVQATPFFAGIVGSPAGTDANGRNVGGGGVTSFAFSSNPTAVAAPAVTVEQGRQLSLADIVGASSAAFAETIGNLFAGWEAVPEDFFARLEDLADDILAFLKTHLGHLAEGLAAAELFLLARKLKARPPKLVADMQSDFGLLKDLIPLFQYWGVTGVEPYPATLPTQFADGGSLENTGLADLLTYTDVERAIAFVNSDQRLEATMPGVLAADGSEVPGTGILISSQIPPLFGYQPHQDGVGYKLYAGDPDPNFPQGRFSQVFPAADFAPFLSGIWAASGSGSSANAALLTQELAVQENGSFGVAGGRSVTVLWVYNNRVKGWYDALAPDVQAILGDFADPNSYSGFPNYSTFSTNLSPTQINLLASLTAWIVAADVNKQAFLDLYNTNSK